MVPQKVTHLNWCQALVDGFQPSIDANPWGFGTALEVLNGCHAFEYEHYGQRAIVAVKPVARQDGTRLDIVGLVSTGDRLDARTFNEGLLDIAARFDATQFAMTTLRPHLAKQCARTGWIQSGVLMIKPIRGRIQ